jgi:cation-transporting ATPase E
MSIALRLVHFVLPAMVTLSMAGLVVYLYFILTSGDGAYAQLGLTYANIVMGLILVVFVEPPSRFWVGGDEIAGDWRPAILAMGLFLAFLAGLGLPVLRDFYGLSGLRQATDYVVVGAVSLLWMLVVRWIWRARLFDRYLGLGPDGHRVDR